MRSDGEFVSFRAVVLTLEPDRHGFATDAVTMVLGPSLRCVGGRRGDSKFALVASFPNRDGNDNRSRGLI